MLLTQNHLANIDTANAVCEIREVIGEFIHLHDSLLIRQVCVLSHFSYPFELWCVVVRCGAGFVSVGLAVDKRVVLSIQVFVGGFRFLILIPFGEKKSNRLEVFTPDNNLIRIAHIVALTVIAVNGKCDRLIGVTDIDYLYTLTVTHTRKPHDFTLSVVVHLYSAPKRFSDYSVTESSRD